MEKKKETEVAFDVTFVRRFVKAVTFSEAVQSLSQNLLDKDLVTKDYPAAVEERELKFPTGLPTTPIGTAIPHTDPQYVKTNAVSVGILEHPIEMTVMGTGSDKVEVSVIFLLSLSESNKQLNILSRIMKLVQDQTALKSFMSASNSQIVEDVRKAILEVSK